MYTFFVFHRLPNEFRCPAEGVRAPPAESGAASSRQSKEAQTHSLLQVLPPRPTPVGRGRLEQWFVLFCTFSFFKGLSKKQLVTFKAWNALLPTNALLQSEVN